MLTVDSREARGKPLIAASLARLLPPTEYEEALLHAGDYAALDTPLSVGIERKSLSNLCGSLASNELDEQLARMVDVYDCVVLLVEGFPNPTADGKVRFHGKGKHEFSYAWLMGACAGWYGRGVWPLFVESEAGTPLAVVTVYNVFKKLQHRDSFLPRKVLPSLRPLSTVTRMLLQLPGVGPERAVTVAATGVTAAQMFAWSSDEWQAALGKVTGARVWRELNGP